MEVHIMKNNKQKIGQRIKELRELKGMTQSQLGEALFVSDKTVSKWEKGNSEPESNLLVQMAKLFNVTLDYLLTGDNPETENTTISQIELACREDNIALLDGIDFEAFDEKGKNLDYYISKYKAYKVRHFYTDWLADKSTKEEGIKKKYYICAIPKGLEGEDNLCLLAWGGPYSTAAAKCAEYEKDGFHHFKVFSGMDVNDKCERDYQYFWVKYLGDDGRTKMVMSTNFFDDMESGVLELTIFKTKTFKENKIVDGKLVPDYYPASNVEYSGAYYIKPQIMSMFLNALTKVDLKNWENRHWGVQFHEFFFLLKEPPIDNQLASHKFYVAPGLEKYKKFVKAIQQLCLESLTSLAYKKFVNAFDGKYWPYYRANLSIAESRPLFREIEKEMEEIKNKKFELDENEYRYVKEKLGRK